MKEACSENTYSQYSTIHFQLLFVITEVKTKSTLIFSIFVLHWKIPMNLI